MSVKYRKGGAVKAYGFGMLNTDFHNGCKGVMFAVEDVMSCKVPYKKFKVIGVTSEDGSTEFFHPKQLEAIKKRAVKK